MDTICFVKVVFGGNTELTSAAMACDGVVSWPGKVGVNAARHDAARNRIFRAIFAGWGPGHKPK